MSPLVGVCGETGDVLALRARGGGANAGRAMGSFIDECVSAIPAGCRGDYQLWVRVDSAGYRADVVEAAERHGGVFTITAKGYTNVRAAVEALATDPTTVWAPAMGAEDAKGSEVAETMFAFTGRGLRMIVRRQRTRAGEQLSFDDLDGWRFHAIITNIPHAFGSAADVEHHHRLRGGAPEEAIRRTSGSATPHSRTSSATGCGGTPPLWPTTSPAGSGCWRCRAPSGPVGASGCACRSSTWPPGSCAADGGSYSGFPVPTPTPPLSSMLSLDCAGVPSSAEAEHPDGSDSAPRGEPRSHLTTLTTHAPPIRSGHDRHTSIVERPIISSGEGR